jgi:hypothetical protein
MTNIKIVISKENYPQDKLTEADQYHILKELGRVFQGTQELSHMSFLRLEKRHTYLGQITFINWVQGPG